MAAEPSANVESPRSPRDSLLRRTTPWAQVVRGAGDSTETAAPPTLSPEKVACSSPVDVTSGESSDKANGGNVVKKPAWNKPSNGVSGGGGGGADQVPGGGSASNAAVVMGGYSAWPALSESTRPPLKSDSLKSTLEGSGMVSSHTQEPEQGSVNTNHNNTGMNNVGPARQRLVRRGGGGGNRQGSFSRGSPAPSRPPPFPVPEMAPSGFGNVVPVCVPDSSSREPRPNEQANHHRGSNRRGNYGQQNRGDGRNNYRGNRRDHDRANNEWNPSQNHQAMDAHGVPHLLPAMGFMRPPLQVAPPFPVPPPFRPYGNAMAYPGDVPPVFYYPLPADSFRGLPSFPAPPPSPPYVAIAEPPLHISIVKQIDYYFSDANLVKDEYLRKNMDGHGWVNVGLIASFPRVQNLTKNIPLILQCLRNLSSVVEVQGNKVRRRHDWMKWVAHNQVSRDSNMQVPAGSTDDMLAHNLQNASLEEVNHDRTLSELADGSQVTNREKPESVEVSTFS